MSKPGVREDHQQGRRCQYRDPATGQQCGNRARRGKRYCRQCARKVRALRKLHSISTVDHDLNKGKLTDKAAMLLPDRIREECLTFLTTLRRHISISQAVLYGSYAQGRAHPWSDVDLAVISSEFHKLPFLRRTILLRRIGLEANTPRIQAIGFTPKEFESAEYPRIVRKVREGVPLFST